MIRNATIHDRDALLDFCRDTFSWGDYVHHVWDSWLSEGSIHVHDNGSPVGMCHASYHCGQTWIEGIRVHPDFRNRGIASGLVRHAETSGRARGCSSSAMAIETTNVPSLSMTRRMGYETAGTWRFYTMDPGPSATGAAYVDSFDVKKLPVHVVSWRWLPVCDMSGMRTNPNCHMARSGSGDPSFAVISGSEHFRETAIATVSRGSADDLADLLSFIRNHAHQKGYRHVHIATTGHLPEFDTLEYQMSLHLVRKQLESADP